MKQIDSEAIRFHIRGILEALGDDPDREGLKETPDRVARMYEEVFEGMKYSNDEIADMFDKTFAEDVDDEGTSRYGDMVVVKDIDIFSYCEHHMALMYDMKVTVAYLPKGKVIGLSKIARGDFLNRNNPNCRQELFYIVSFSSFPVYRRVGSCCTHSTAILSAPSQSTVSSSSFFTHRKAECSRIVRVPLATWHRYIPMRNSAILTPSCRNDNDSVFPSK